MQAKTVVRILRAWGYTIHGTPRLFERGGTGSLIWLITVSRKTISGWPGHGKKQIVLKYNHSPHFILQEAAQRDRYALGWYGGPDDNTKLYPIIGYGNRYVLLDYIPRARPLAALLYNPRPQTQVMMRRTMRKLFRRFIREWVLSYRYFPPASGEQTRYTRTRRALRSKRINWGEIQSILRHHCINLPPLISFIFGELNRGCGSEIPQPYIHAPASKSKLAAFARKHGVPYDENALNRVLRYTLLAQRHERPIVTLERWFGKRTVSLDLPLMVNGEPLGFSLREGAQWMHRILSRPVYSYTITHGDLSIENVLVTNDGIPWLIDPRVGVPNWVNDVATLARTETLSTAQTIVAEPPEHIDGALHLTYRTRFSPLCAMVTTACIRAVNLFIVRSHAKSVMRFHDHEWRVRFWTYQALAYLNEARFCKERRRWRKNIRSMQYPEMYCIGEAMRAVAKAMAEVQRLAQQGLEI